MSKQTRFMSFIFRQGESATINSVTGTTCPCWAVGVTGYNPQWHADYPAAEACNGTGLIVRTTTQTSIKAKFYPAGVIGMSDLPEDFKTAIGEKQEDHILMYGQCNASTGAYVSVSGYTEDDDYITYNSVNYRFRKVYTLPEILCQVSLLVKK